MRIAPIRFAAVIALGGLLALPGYAKKPPAKKNAAGDSSSSTGANPSTTAPAPQPGTSPAPSSPASTDASTAAPPPDPPPQKEATIGGSNAPKWLPMAATSGTLGLFTAETADLLPMHGVSFEAGVNKFSRSPGDITVLNVGWSVAYGVRDWFNIFVQWDPHRHIHVGRPDELSLDKPTTPPFFPFDNTIYQALLPCVPAPTTCSAPRPGYVEDYPFASKALGGIGDLDLGFKVRLLSQDQGKPVSLSVRSDFYIPTVTGLSGVLGNSTQTGQFNLGLGLALSRRFSDAMVVTTNFDYRFTRDPRFAGLTAMHQADQMNLAFGFLALPKKRINLISEYSATVFVGTATPDTSFDPRDPVAAVWGARFYFTRWMAMDVGYRYMANLRNVKDRHGFVLKLATTYWPEVVRPPDNVNVTCSADKTSVVQDSGATVALAANATDSLNHTLHYTWVVTGGQIRGSGATAQWDPAGLAPGTYTVSVHVDDGQGNTATCSEDLQVTLKPVPPPAMTCSAERSALLAGERTGISATVNDQSGTPLNFTWQANGGQIVGAGANVQFDSTGLAPGTYAVTGRAENGKGGAADCTVNVTVQAPPAPPQASKINECVFRPASSLVDNVCKRVLDDIALRLQNDPKARIIVVGYADPREPRSGKLAQNRGANIQKYLAAKKGADPSRVDVRSASGQTGAGQADRRADIVWVPEGATY